MQRTLALLALALPLTAACGDDPEPADAGPVDAGGSLDAGASPDGGGASDVGPTMDAGADAGTPDLGYRPGCEDARFRQGPLDPAVAGPWPVGVRTASVAGLTTEIWYPAEPGSATSTLTVSYDLRAALPDSEAGKIADADNPVLPCDCRRDLPLDASHGPYPVIVFVHGTAGIRAQSVAQMTHWASRGFVVLSADHPGLYLKDVLAAACGQGMTPRDVEGDVRRLVDAVRSADGGPLAFLAGAIDTDRLGLSGHSAGGRAVEGLGDLGRVIVPLAAGGVMDGAALESVLVMGGTSDRVVPIRQQIEGYEAAPAPKRLVLLDNAGHLAFSAFCDLQNGAGQNIVEVAMAAGVCGTGLASFLFDCNPAYLPDREAWAVVNHATTAAFEATLQCRTEAEAELSATETRFSQVSEQREAR